MNSEEAEEIQDVSRRRFFQLTGGIAGAGILLSATPLTAGTFSTNMGKGDTALLNFLYILQQIESAFYTEAVAQQNGLSNTELATLLSVQKQEATHTKILKKMLGSKAVGDVATNFTAVTFSDRGSLLKHAATIEDMVVAGLNGAAGLFENSDHPLALSKMVMAEAGHSAYFRNKLSLNSFGDDVAADGLDQTMPPAAVLALAEAYTHTQFDKTNLPNHTNI